MTTTTARPPSTPAGSRTPPRWLPTLAAGVTMTLWASAFIVIRTTGAHYSPGATALGRLATGALVLTAVAVRRPRRLPRGRPLALVVAYGALWFGLYAVAINAAEQRLDAGTTALLVNLGPVLIAVLSGIFLGEGFPRTLIAGLLVALSGVTVIAAVTSTGARDPAGALIALAAAVLYALGVLLQKQALRDVDPFTATWLGCVVGAACCLPFAADLVATTAHAPPSAVAGLLYLGIFPTAIAFSTWAYALAHSDAGRLGASSYLVPALAVLMSWLLLGEPPAPAALLGGALCLVGVAVTRLRRAGGAPSRPALDVSDQ